MVSQDEYLATTHLACVAVGKGGGGACERVANSSGGGGDPFSWIGEHWRGELQIVAIVATVASAGAGGAVFLGGDALVAAGIDVGDLTAVSTAGSLVSGVANLPGCVSGDAENCVDAATGIAGFGLSGGGQIAAKLAANASPAAGLLFSQAFSLSAGTATWDSVYFGTR